MSKIYRSKRLLLSAIGLIAWVVGITPASATSLPTCIPNVTCLQYGDFNVFSLPLLNLQATGSAVPGPGDPYYYPASYGQIKSYTIMGINNGQSTQTGNPSGSVDGAYNTPSPNNTTNGAFSTVTSETPGGTADPGGAGQFTGDSTNSWDARTSSLLSLIGGTPLTAFFAFNETGSGTGLDTTDLLIWARVYLSNDSGSQNTAFYLSGDGSQNIPCTSTGITGAGGCNVALPAADATDFGPWVYVHAGICADANGNFVGFPDTSGQCPVGDVYANQNNLGQNAAAFMVNSPALDAALSSGLYSYMQITWKMAYINGGGETAWIEPMTRTVPEPRTLALLGIGVLALGVTIARRRRRSP